MAKTTTFINTYPSGGGAAIACNRLLEVINSNTSINAILVNDGFIQKQKISNKLPSKAKYINLIRFFIERFFINKELNKGPLKALFSPGIISSSTIISLIKKNNPDIIHLHWINHGFIGIKALQKIAELNKPIVWTLHDMWAFTGGCHHSMQCNNFTKTCGNCFYLKKPNENDLSNQIFLEKLSIFKSMDLTIVCPSNWLANKAKESTLLKNAKINVIPNPIDTSHFKASDKKSNKQKLNLPLDKILICFVAANINNPFKGANKLMEALGKLGDNISNKSKIELLVLGKNDDSDNIFENIPFKTHFAGFVSDTDLMIQYYNAADIFVLPSLQDNLPNTVMEALACGTPVVAFNTGGVGDMVDNNVGYLAKYNDSDDLSNGIKTLIENDELRQNLSLNAVNKVKDTFASEVVAKQYLEVYNSALKIK